MLLNRSNSRAGFSLVEIMIGLVISLLATLAITQTLTVYEGQKRTTMSGATAQEDGMTSLRVLESDVRMAGYGFTANGTLACTTLNVYHNGAAGFNQPLMPVQITDGGAAADMINTTYSSSDAGGVPTLLVLPAASSDVTVSVNSANGYNVGDMVLVALPGSGLPCTRLQITALNIQGYGVDIVHDSGASVYNPPVATNLFPAGGYSTTPVSTIFNMGTFVNSQYQILCDTLTVASLTNQTGAPACTDQNTFTNTSPVANDVVNLQAQYGIAPAGTQSVTCWVNATNGGNTCDAGNWANPSAVNIARIKAIRLAVVVRSSLTEKANVTTGCTNISGVANLGPCAWPDTAAMPAPLIDLSADPDWQRYRYRVFQTIIPLRNVLWGNI